MPNPNDIDKLHMDIALRVAQMSKARRSQVGAVLTNGDNIISYGWNGTPSGDDNNCEHEKEDGTLETKRHVLHAEANALMKLVSSGGVGAHGATLYVTLSPCFECAKLIKQSKISRVVYREQYRETGGVDFLRQRGVQVDHLE